MRIAVVGSFPSKSDERWPLRGSANRFQRACFSLGELIARLGYELDVQYDRPEDADTYVVNGYMREATQSPMANHRIRVWQPQRRARSTPFGALMRQVPKLFAIENAGTGKWDSARFEMCWNADTTVMIGGQARSEMSGYLVMAAGRTLIPISSFGGAAASMLPLLEKGFLSAQALPSPLSVQTLKQVWSSDLLRRIEASLIAAPTVVVIHGSLAHAARVKRYISRDLRWRAPVTLMRDEYEAGETLPDKWQRIAGTNHCVAIAIASADDVGRRKRERKEAVRARQNVWLEVGWFWGRGGGLKRILILPQAVNGDSGVEVPSDLQGLEVFRWKRDPLEQKKRISDFLRRSFR